MKRRHFLTLALTAGPAAAIAAADAPKPGQTAPKSTRPKGAVRVASGGDRFEEKIVLPSGSPNDCKVSSKDTDGAMCAFESTVVQKGGPPLHVHPDQDEWFFVLEGEFEFQVGEEHLRLGAGDSVLAPRQVAHSWARVSDKPGKMVIVFQPAGRMEAFFREYSKLKGPPAPGVMPKLFMDHGMKIVGPPLKIE